MGKFSTITVVVGVSLAGISTGAAAQSGAPAVVAKERPTAARGDASTRVCGVVHQEGRSGCTHDRLRSRRTMLAWLGGEPGEEGTLTAEEQRELDRLADGLQPVHDRRNSMYLLIMRPTPEQLRSCPAAPATAGGAAELARPHKWRRSIRHDLPCPKW